jgi:hypothetical protein
MTCIDHFEIEAKRPGGAWEHVGNVYPKYVWRVRRPWYFLWLVRRPTILNDATVMATLLFIRIRTRALLQCRLLPGEAVRIVEWRRGRFGRLTKVPVWECK